MSDTGPGARMIEVGEKPITARSALAEGWVTTTAEVIARVREGRVEKGDVLRVAEVAGLMGLKRTADLLPMCHPLPVSGAELRAEIAEDGRVRITARARTLDRTGVEMEVLTAVSVAALTVYDLLKMYDPAMVIGPVRLLEKDGGKSGHWTA